MTRRARSIGALALALGAVALLGLAAGTPTLDPAALARALVGDDPARLVWDYRVPRVTYTVLVGATMALAGALLQAGFDNDLAEPGLIGLPAGGATGALVGLVFFAPLAGEVPLFVPLCALAGAAAVTAVADAVARRAGPQDVLLIGVVLAASLTALDLTLATVGPRRHYDLVFGWMAGSMSFASWAHLALLAPVTLALGALALRVAPRLDALALGEEVAQSLGVRVRATRRVALALACGLAATCVAVGGSVLFLGLLAPHLARRLVGPRHCALLPASAAVGGLALLVADVGGRLLLPDAPLPAGVVVAVVGGPVFLALLARRRRPARAIGGRAPRGRS